MHRVLFFARRASCAALLLPLVLAATPAPAQHPGDAALRNLADRLLPSVEALSGLEAKEPLRVARRSRAELRAYLAAELEKDIAAGELQAAEIVYKRLGLLPPDLDLAATATALANEQVSGYYDPERDTLYVLDDVPPGELGGILVHEMVHALQDQHAPLDSLIDPKNGNDRRTAARAAIEGHALLVMLLFAAEEMGRSSDDLPNLSAVPLDLIFADRPLPALAAAPVILREGLLFPYARGAGFVQALWKRERGAVPFGELLPLSSEQVMDPQGRFFGENDPPTEIRIAEPPNGLPSVGDAGEGGETAADGGASNGWRTEYENSLGQFELALLLEERHYRMGTEKYAQGWDGDRYRLLSDGERHVLDWYLVWDDAQAAYDFANAYRQILGPRLNRTASVEQMTIDGRPVVRIIDAEEGVDLTTIPQPRITLEEAAS